MLLAVDVGNTNTVVGAYPAPSSGRVLPTKSWRMATHPVGTADDFRARLQGLMMLDGMDLRDVRTVTVSSVVPQLTEVLRGAFPADRTVEIIDASWPFSFAIEASPASQVGADRLVNAEAVVREYGAPAIVVDSGTATTVCAISSGGSRAAYLGGAIMPGIELSIQALARSTAKLFSVELVPPERAIGSNTVEAIRSGVLLGYAEMIDGMVRRFRAELGDGGCRVIATGGVSARLKGIAREITHVDPDLTLKGIFHLHHHYQAFSRR